MQLSNDCSLSFPLVDKGSSDKHATAPATVPATATATALALALHPALTPTLALALTQTLTLALTLTLAPTPAPAPAPTLHEQARHPLVQHVPAAVATRAPAGDGRLRTPPHPGQ